MRRLKFLGLALVAVFASAAALSTSAFAAELLENLPELAAKETRAFTGKAIGNTELHAEGQKAIVCTGAKGEGTEETSKPPLGLFHIAFENCQNEAAKGVFVKCTGLGDATAGTILALGTWHLVFDKEIGKTFEKLTTAELFLSNAVHFTCGGLVLVEVLAGETLCLHLNPTENVKVHEFHCIGAIVGGVPKAIEEWGTEKQLEESKGIVPVLKASVNHEPEVPALQLGLGTVEYKVNVQADQ